MNKRLAHGFCLEFRWLLLPWETFAEESLDNWLDNWSADGWNTSEPPAAPADPQSLRFSQEEMIFIFILFYSFKQFPQICICETKKRKLRKIKFF